MTSRGSARHGSGRYTQRDSGSAGCPTSRSVTACKPDDQDATAVAAVARLSLPTSRVSLDDARTSACCDGDGDSEGEKTGDVPRSPPSVHGGSPVSHEIESGGRAGVVVDVGGGGGGIPSDATTADPMLLPSGDGRSARREMPRLQLGELPANENVTKKTQEELVSEGGSHRARIAFRQSDTSLPLSSREEVRTALLELDAGYCGSEAGELEGDAPDGNLMSLVSAKAAADTRPLPPHSTQCSRLDTSITENNKLEAKVSDDRTDEKRSVKEPQKQLAQKIDPVMERVENSSERGGSQMLNAPSIVGEPCTRRARNVSRLIADKSPATIFVLRLAYASAPPETSLSQKPSKPTPVDDLSSEVAVAKLLVSMLPVVPVERDAEEALAIALDVLSLAGTLSWADLASWTFDREAEDLAKNDHGAVDDDALCVRWSAAWPRELDTVDIVLLASAAEAYLDARWLVLRSQLERTREEQCGRQDIGSISHRKCVRRACGLGLECTWLTRCLLRKIVSAGALDGQFRPSLPAETVTSLIKYCGRALDALPGDIFSLVGPASCRKPGDADIQQTPTFPAGGDINEGDAKLLLLAAPAVVGVVSSLTALLDQPAAWGEDIGWATTMLASKYFCDRKGALIPVLIRLFERLVASVLSGKGHFFEPAELETGPPSSARASPSAGSGSTTRRRRLPGAADALGEVLVAVIQSLDALLRRTLTIVEACRDLSSCRAGRWHSEDELSVATAVVRGGGKKDEYATSKRDYRGRVSKNTAFTAAMPLASDDMEALAKEDGPTSDEYVGTTVVRSILREISPVFRPEGPVLAILNAQFVTPSQPNGDRDGGRSATSTPSDKSLPVMPTPCLVAALHLSAAFFSVRVKSHDAARHQKGDTRLNDFVGPILTGFHLRECYNRGRRDGVKTKADGSVRRGGQKEGGEEGLLWSRLKHVENKSLLCGEEEEEEKERLCQIHLEALVELSLTGDPAVQKELHKQRVAQILGNTFFGDGSAADGSEGLLELSTSLLRPVGSSSDGRVHAPPLSSHAVDAAPPERDFDPARDHTGVPDAVATSLKTPRDVPSEEASC